MHSSGDNPIRSGLNSRKKSISSFKDVQANEILPTEAAEIASTARLKATWINKMFPRSMRDGSSNFIDQSESSQLRQSKSKRKGLWETFGLPLGMDATTAIMGSGYARPPSVSSRSLSNKSPDVTVEQPFTEASMSLPVEPTVTSASSIHSEVISDEIESGTIIQGSAIPAIVNATRVMTREHNSVLLEPSLVHRFIASKAWELVDKARSQALTVRIQSKPKATRRRSSVGKGLLQETNSITHSSESTNPFTTELLNGENPRPNQAANNKTVKGLGTLSASALAPFALGYKTLVPGAPRKQAKDSVVHTPANVQVTISQQDQDRNVPSTPIVKSVAMGHIVPPSAKPPTQRLPPISVLTSPQWNRDEPLSQFVAPTEAASYEASELTDRYGFIYFPAQYDTLLLVRGLQAKCNSPATLTGIKIANRSLDHGELATSDLTMETMSGKGVCASEDKHDIDTSRYTLTAEGFNPLSPLEMLPSSPKYTCPHIIRVFLDSHNSSHVERQKALESSWDAFLTQRTKSMKSGKSGRLSASQAALLSNPSAAAALLGFKPTSSHDDEQHDREVFIGFTQLAGSEERRELDRLIRLGVPLAYRKNIWAECSGALELAEPGVFAELLAEDTYSGQDEKRAERDIDKDIRRTMPGNVFFGGQGPGVEKLRRVLLAYSRYVLFDLLLNAIVNFFFMLGGIHLLATARV